MGSRLLRAFFGGRKLDAKRVAANDAALAYRRLPCISFSAALVRCCVALVCHVASFQLENRRGRDIELENTRAFALGYLFGLRSPAIMAFRQESLHDISLRSECAQRACRVAAECCRNEAGQAARNFERISTSDAFHFRRTKPWSFVFSFCLSPVLAWRNEFQTKQLKLSIVQVS